MRENRPSTTAQIVAMLRAALSAPAVGLVDDPYAMTMLRPLFRPVARALQLRLARPILGLADLGTASTISLLAGRTRFFDDAIISAISDGIRQIVLLGAGYDARALRLSATGVRFFEVDHPATQADKKQKIEALGREYPATFVTVDFTKDRLEDRLLAAGFDPEARTFFLWEGVIMYLSESQVRETLKALKKLAAPKSQLSFDCIRENLGGIDLAWARLGQATFAGLFGEPLDFRCDPEKLATLLQEEGFRLLEAASAESLHQKYLAGGPLPKPRPIGFVALAERSTFLV